MQNKISKKIIVYILVLLTALSTALSSWLVVKANPTGAIITSKGEASLGDGNASITITTNNGQSLIGKKIMVYQLFNAENSLNGESINYTFVNESKSALQNVVGKRLNKYSTEVTEYEVIDYIHSLNQANIEGSQTKQNENGYYSSFRYFVEELRTELNNLRSNASYAVHITDVQGDGSICLNGLKYGYYIVDDVSLNAGSYSASSLCMVTTANPSSVIRIKADYPGVSKKIKEDDKQDVVGNDGWNDIGDYEIGQNIPFKFISKVSNMNGYKTYYFAWHDIMDDAFTFDPNSVKITISNNSYDYILSKSEYAISENKDGESFVISIEDLKKIIDIHFNKIDSIGHNTYDQTIVLEYTARLNDMAAERLSNKGYENDVRVEFSNDPDVDGNEKTGYTPWDTVVCYTYGLNGLKVNNHNLELENAKFRLYNDEKCENEVFLKKADNYYIVMNHDIIGENLHLNAAEVVSDKNGQFNIVGLDSGIYYLKETDAPDGYREIQDPIRIEIIPSYSCDRNYYIKGQGANILEHLDFVVDIKQFLSGVFNKESKNLNVNKESLSGNLIVVNTVGTKLPVTGSFLTIAMVGLGISIMLFAIISIRKRGQY